MWQLQPDDEYLKRIKNKNWLKKYQREFAAIHDNLDTLIKTLNSGAKVEEAIKRGYIHREPRQIIAIDQKGGGAGLKQSRLYVYLDKRTNIVHLITIGDKSTQKGDIQYSINFVDTLLASKE